MSGLVDASGLPIGRVGESRVSEPGLSKDPQDLARVWMAIEQKRASMEGEAAIAQLVNVPRKKIEIAVAFWKPLYFDVLIDGRHLNGIEAYELGDPSKTPEAKVNKSIYIAMCNLMALEGILMMGSNMPTSTEAVLLAFATKREKEVAAFWKKNFAPTEFQVEWAWKACLAVLAGDPSATAELLDNYRLQLP